MELADFHPKLSSLLAQVDSRLAELWMDDDDFLGTTAERSLSGRGKRLRPSVLLLAAECAGGATEKSVVLGTVVELVHAASLVHDDVVDEAASRHGRRSANAIWGNKVSVLLGDYLVARALALLPEGERDVFVPELAEVAARMCVGQVRELRAVGHAVTESDYVEIARSKTGSLFSFCGQAGVWTTSGTPRVAKALARFGEKFGIAFQFADDILDLVGTDGQSGKPEGRDLAEHKFTLPLILAFEMGGCAVRERIEQVLARAIFDCDGVAAVRELVKSTGAFEASWSRVRGWLADAEQELEAVPESRAKETLVAVCGDLFPMPVMAY